MNKFKLNNIRFEISSVYKHPGSTRWIFKANHVAVYIEYKDNGDKTKYILGRIINFVYVKYKNKNGANYTYPTFCIIPYSTSFGIEYHRKKKIRYNRRFDIGIKLIKHIQLIKNEEELVRKAKNAQFL